MNDRRPRGREKNITGQGKDIFRRGSGTGTGPVGAGGGRPTGGSSRPTGGRSTGGRSGGGSFAGILILVLLLFFGGGYGLGNLGGETTVPTDSGYPSSGSSSGSFQGVDLSTLLGGSYNGTGFTGGHTSTGWSLADTGSKPDTTVAAGAREKFTTLRGDGRDTVTILVYLCGTDLESKSGMATSDLTEMTKATLSDNVNLLVYTGGCKKWQNSAVSSSVNQIYKVESGGLRRLVADDGSASLVRPETLTRFIRYGISNYPADRNMLIFWDHGGGSLSGFGYDEKNPSAGSMTLSQINTALKDAGATFDLIGFDACLMATAENALMLADYADYLIASEETEPGIGWYYTDWLTELSRNTSMSTVALGKQIADDFVDVCAQRCAGQKATLSVVDLAELEATVPEKLKDFAASTSRLLQQGEFKAVSNARVSAREFATSSRIDQVDLVHLADNMNTDEGSALADALRGAVKYNRTSTNMTNAYGLSIYFPYQRTSKVDQAVKTYEAIGMDDDYSRCIQQFASMEVGGQAVSGGASNPLGALLGSSSGSSSAPGSDLIGQILGGLLSGDLQGVSGLTAENSGFLGRGLDLEGAAGYLRANRFDAGALVWTAGAGGCPVLALEESQWSLVHDLELNVFYDDGAGYIDLGLDNVFDFNDQGDLLGQYDGTWLAINQQPVAYYHLDTYDDGRNYCITGRVPVLLNGDRADLLLVFDNDHPYGYVAGATADYRDGRTETVAKSEIQLRDGDVLDFLCDYYSYDGEYRDSYQMGEQMTVSGSLTISNVYIDASRTSATYRFTDIYNQQYWTPVLP